MKKTLFCFVLSPVRISQKRKPILTVSHRTKSFFFFFIKECPYTVLHEDMGGGGMAQW